MWKWKEEKKICLLCNTIFFFKNRPYLQTRVFICLGVLLLFPPHSPMDNSVVVLVCVKIHFLLDGVNVCMFSHSLNWILYCIPHNMVSIHPPPWDYDPETSRKPQNVGEQIQGKYQRRAVSFQGKRTCTSVSESDTIEWYYFGLSL